MTAGPFVALDPERAARYARQLVIPAIGESGQQRLGAARVRVVCAGAPSAPALVYLALAGVGAIFIDDPEPVTPADGGHWLYPAAAVGQPRETVAGAALQARSRFLQVGPFPAGVDPTAVLVAAPSVAQTVAAAEQARRARIPAVVLEPDGEGGSVVTIPVGAPCFSCARSTGPAARPPVAGAAALAALAAEELTLLIADPSMTQGRRTDLVRGVPSQRATARLAGCACGRAPAPPSP